MGKKKVSIQPLTRTQIESPTWGVGKVPKIEPR